MPATVEVAKQDGLERALHAAGRTSNCASPGLPDLPVDAELRVTLWQAAALRATGPDCARCRGGVRGGRGRLSKHLRETHASVRRDGGAAGESHWVCCEGGRGGCGDGGDGHRDWDGGAIGRHKLSGHLSVGL